MPPSVFLAVLLAAALHAGWNALVKIDLDRFLAVSLISMAAGAAALPMLSLAAPPGREAWPWLALSTLLHTGYKLFLIQAYRSGDLAQVYPVARGAAPLLVIAATTLFSGERLPGPVLAGVLLLVAGVISLSARGGRTATRLEGRATAFALGTSLFIAGYTLTDSLGARLNHDAHGYAVWLFALDGLLMLGVLLATRGRRGLTALRPHLRTGLAGGMMSLCAYWIVIWATTQAPVALVAALRETSILFAALISGLVLREPVTRWRACCALAIVAGIALTRLG